MPKIIGISGKLGSGKNFTASQLQRMAESHGIKTMIIALADHLKIETVAAYSADLIQTRTEYQTMANNSALYHSTTVAAALAKYQSNLITYENVFGQKTEASRNALQTIGHGRRQINPDYWLDIAHMWINVHTQNNKIDLFIITDVRYYNEATTITKWGGDIIRLQAPGRTHCRLCEETKDPVARAKIAGHPSECELDILDHQSEDHVQAKWLINNDNNPEFGDILHKISGEIMLMVASQKMADLPAQ